MLDKDMTLSFIRDIASKVDVDLMLTIASALLLAAFVFYTVKAVITFMFHSIKRTLFLVFRRRGDMNHD